MYKLGVWLQKSNCAIPTKNQKLFLMFHVFVRYLYIFDERNNDMKIYKTAKEKEKVNLYERGSVSQRDSMHLITFLLQFNLQYHG